MKFRDAGVTSVAVQEDTVAGLEDARRISANQTSDTVGGSIGRPLTLLAAPFPQQAGEPEFRLIHRISDALRVKRGFQVERGPAALGTNVSPVISVSRPYAVIRPVGVGLDPDVINDVQTAGLGVIGRVANYEGVTPASLQWTLQGLEKTQRQDGDLRR
jgi:hypothetical protein